MESDHRLTPFSANNCSILSCVAGTAHRTYRSISMAHCFLLHPLLKIVLKRYLVRQSFMTPQNSSVAPKGIMTNHWGTSDLKFNFDQNEVLRAHMLPEHRSEPLPRQVTRPTCRPPTTDSLSLNSSSNSRSSQQRCRTHLTARVC